MTERNCKPPRTDIGSCSALSSADVAPNRKMRRAMKFGHVLRPKHGEGETLQRLHRDGK